MDSKLLSSIYQQNPWLKSGQSPSLEEVTEPHYIHRLQSEFLGQAEWDRLWSLLIGPRQAGKTTLGKHLCDHLIQQKRFSQLLYLNCDYNLIREWLSSATFLSEAQETFDLEKFILFIDEVQRLESPGLLLKIIADLKLPIKMIASGSSQLEIKSKVQEHLTGRQLSTLVLPLSCREIPFSQCYETLLIYGSYPQVYLAKEKNVFLQELFNNYIQKDIIEFLKIGKPDVIRKLVGLLAHSAGQLLNFQQLAVDCQVNVETVRNYISVLEQTFVIQLIRPFVGNKRTELTSNPICYFVDNGFRNKAIENFVALDGRTDAGLLVENLVFQELIKFKAQARKEWDIHYWRTKGGAEVDFVLKKGIDTVIPIEVKYRNMTQLKISRSYRSFLEVYKPQQGFIISKNQVGKLKVGETMVHFIPLHSLPDYWGFYRQMRNFEKQLSKGITQLGLSIPVSSQQRMIEGLYFLQKWNQAYNLTAVREIDAMMTHHLLDSLSIASYVQGLHILDVGTGAGFPGIPLALMYPEKQFVLLDSRGKKTRFLLQLAAELNLLNVKVVQARMEDFSAEECFDAIMCRAVGKMADVVAKTEHLMCTKGQWLMMKGEYPRDELEKITRPAVVHKLSIPGLTVERHVVIIQKNR